ncbi:hypothetical protein [Intestinimonas butyriciproducens]|uniref:hypothetical protein n=1 Tax=Intestinimonas butyriciproducens TaxID=1297617 RepID=UPI0018AA14D2|nr:hypothetical protein [Intestinimonas butyriciproducens]MDB7816359.1 hypothetical protein [Intestinimonas butyriciproducens]MDB7842871.1 hypothetical protein [Intestinimonas butyriciproducens]MDB7857381.1 hypothetical protein [Intestinimonas butyriciproducens]
MKKRVIAVVAASAATLCTAVTIAVGGTAGDPMLSKSYIDGAYTVQTISKAEEKITLRHDTLYQSAEETLKAKNEDYLTRGGLVTGDGTYQAAFSDLRVKEGDTVRIETGSGFLLLAGDVELSCTGNKTIDISNGWEKGSGALTAGRRYLVVEDTVAVLTVTSPTAVLSLEGYYTLTESSATDYNALADGLKALGLFKGSDTGYGFGYDLEAKPTRIQALIMFLRLIGEEQAALSTTAACPFTDVPAWCQPYVAYAYEQGLTKGVDDAAMLFGTADYVTAGQYVTFILRALGYQDSGDTPDFTWDTALQRGMDLGILTAGEYKMLVEEPFLRAQVAYLSYFALDHTYKDRAETLQTQLTTSGVLDAADVAAVRGGIDVSRLT